MRNQSNRTSAFLLLAGCAGAVFLGGCTRPASDTVAPPARPKTREVLVVETGRNSTVILLATNATTSAQFAALELQDHLEKITGEKVPVANEPNVPSAPVKIAVGATALSRSLGFPVDALAPWEFMVGEKQGVIVLAGGDEPTTEKANRGSVGLVYNGKPNGTCRAVYEFLEEYCGVHWYLPSEAGLVFPRTQRLAVRMGYLTRRRTDYRSTSFYPYQVNGKMFCAPDTPELTGANAPDRDAEKWRAGRWTIPVKTTDMLPVAEVVRWLVRNKVGGEPYGPNHSFGNWITRFGQDHPEWFSYKSKEKIAAILAKGAGPANIGRAWGEFHETGEPCLTAPGVFEQVVADARDYADRQRGAGDPARKEVVYQGSQGRFFGIVPNDNYVLCRCPGCSPRYNRPVVDCPLWGSATGEASFYVWDFINRVARELRQTHPEAWIGGIGYHNYMPPPRDFTLEPNVAVNLCTYLGNWTPALRETVYKLVRAWREPARCQWIGLWEYFCYCAMAGEEPMFPKVCPKLMGADVKQLHRLGVVAEFIEGEEIYRFKDDPEKKWAIWSNPIWLYLNVWMRFKMWDDSSRNVDQLLNDHYRLFYGPAAVPVQRFFEKVEARITDMTLRGPKTFNDTSCNRPMADFEYLFPKEVMQELRALVDEATMLANEEPWKTRVGWVRMGFLEPQEKALTRYLDRKKRTPASRPSEGIGYRLKPAPTIDGDGTDEAWKGMPAYFLGQWRTGARPKVETRFRMGHDDSALYFWVRCEDPDAKRLRTECRVRDGDVYQDDCVEFHVTLDPQKSQRFQIIVNSQGTIQDLRHQMNEAGADVSDRTWNCEGVQAAARTDAKGYAVEIRIPLAGLGGAAKAATTFQANVARAKYSGSTGNAAIELSAWSPTQTGFNDPRYFGRVLRTEPDGWRLFFSQETSPPPPILYKVDEKNPWTPAAKAIESLADRDTVRYQLRCPAVAEKGGRIYGGFAVKVEPPVDVIQYPNVEVAFSKPSQDVMLELLYDYVGEDGKDHHNYLIMSPYGEGGNVTQVFVRRFAEGCEKDRPAPKRLKGLTVYAVVEGNKTPCDTEFSLKWIRVCQATLRGSQP